MENQPALTSGSLHTKLLFVLRRSLVVAGSAVSLLFATACSDRQESDGNGEEGGLTQAPGNTTSEPTSGSASTADATVGTSTEAATAASGDGSTSAGVDETPVKFDLGALPDAPDGSFCAAPLPVSCDEQDDDPWRAIGLNCPGGSQVMGSYAGHPDALHVHAGNLGTHNPPPWPPREGQKFAILSSGIAADLPNPAAYSSTSLPDNDPGFMLPPPLRPNPVSDTQTCGDNPDLVGTGDCSNTIESQWAQGGVSGANDYASLIMETDVPAGTFGLSFDFAFFSFEYPNFYKSQFNDMFIAWLESEQWTGNISFDEAGHPISLNAGFLDYKDAPNSHGDCPEPCVAPELTGTGMDGHAGTKWLTTQAPVTPGEHIELIFAIFDLSDGILDSVVILDNFQWNCDGGPPITVPG